MRGADLDAKDVKGYAALHYAVESTSVKMVRQLVECGLPVESRGYCHTWHNGAIDSCRDFKRPSAEVISVLILFLTKQTLLTTNQFFLTQLFRSCHLQQVAQTSVSVKKKREMTLRPERKFFSPPIFHILEGNFALHCLEGLLAVFAIAL
jgi:hypothetical protein